jgi:DNA-binding NtrC family response regulator
MLKIPANILVVDDEKDFVEMLSLRLKDKGQFVEGVFSGRDCLAALSKNDYDIVILDIKMPGMDGIETLKEIKRQYPLIEVILLTGHGSIDTAVEGMKLGAFDYLNKPADFEELLEKLESARKRRAEHEERIRKAEAQVLLRRTGDI